MNASRCCTDRAFCLHMPLMVTLIDPPAAANDGVSRLRAGASPMPRAGATSAARCSSDRRSDDCGAPREVS